MKILDKKLIKRIAIVFTSEHFLNALHTTITVVVPVIALCWLGWKTAGIYIGLGTFLVALSDVRGDVYDKFGSLTISSLTLSLVSMAIWLVLPSPLLLGILIVVFCFDFSMLSLYGGSISAIGFMALIVMVFTIGLTPTNDIFFSFFILVGGLWYTLSATVYASVFRYRPIRHAIGECLMETAGYVRAKTGFYQPDQALSDCYRRAIAGHLKVSEKQEALRSILLKEGLVTPQENMEVRRLTHLAAEVIDLYEQILAVHYDYAHIRQMLDDLHLLKPVRLLIEQLAEELYETGIALRLGTRPQQRLAGSIPILIAQLKNAAADATGMRLKVVSRIIVNFEVVFDKIQLIGRSVRKADHVNHSISGRDAIRFRTHEPASIKQFLHHLNIHSPIFRFALRTTLACLAAYLMVCFVLPGKYGYWLLLTIIIIARPGFTVTRKRNFQRLTGTSIGIAVSFIILCAVQGVTAQIVFIICCMLGYLAFLYVNYLTSVVFITIVVIVGLHLLGGDNDGLMLERAYETLLGGAAALGAAFIFPFWESKKIKDMAAELLAANISYLQQLRNFVAHKPFDTIEYKLARKKVFVSSANLSRAYQCMLAEPAAKNFDSDVLYQFQVFNHELYASVASLLLDSAVNSPMSDNTYNMDLVDKSIAYLDDTLKGIKGIASQPVKSAEYDQEIKPIEGTPHKIMVSEQLQLILDLARNIHLQASKVVFTK